MPPTPVASFATLPERAPSRSPVVNLSDRLWDLVALVLILAGISMFIMARNALTSMANGTFTPPPGSTHVERADYFAMESTIGMFVAGAGIVIGVIAAIRHARRRTPIADPTSVTGEGRSASR